MNINNVQLCPILLFITGIASLLVQSVVGNSDQNDDIVFSNAAFEFDKLHNEIRSQLFDHDFDGEFDSLLESLFDTRAGKVGGEAKFKKIFDTGSGENGHEKIRKILDSESGNVDETEAKSRKFFDTSSGKIREEAPFKKMFNAGSKTKDETENEEVRFKKMFDSESTKKDAKMRKKRSPGHVEMGEAGMEAVMQRFSFTNNINRLHSIMKIPELIKSQGYPSEVHKVVTADGYILELHRIPGPRKQDEAVLPQMQSRKSRKRETRRKRKSFQKRSVDSDSSHNTNNKLQSSFNQTSPATYTLPNNVYNSNISSLLPIPQSMYKTSEYNISDSQRDVLVNLLKRRLGEELLNINEFADFGESGDLPSRQRRQTQSVEEVFIPQGLISPFRGITNLALPIINKPPINLNAPKQPARFVKYPEPSPRRSKARFFKNTSSSIDFSGRRDFEISKFFGASRGDSGASGRPVVLLHHGLLSSSANFVLNDAHEALAYVLADAGYDVWLANWRGNSYSRGHVFLDPDHADYWNFSLDEVIRHDIPAIFDYILRKTKQRDLYYIGHSLGCVMLWGATNYYPNLNSKVRLMVALAPAGFMDNAEGLMKKMALFMKNYYRQLESVGIRELFVPNNIRTTLSNTFCGPQNPFMKICYLLLPLYIGEVRGSHDPYYTDVFLSHFPGGTSTLRILAQFGQFIDAGGMQMFDFGPKSNMRRYGQPKPPKYSFKTVTCPVAVMWALGDTVTSPRDVQLCVRHLPHVVLNHQVPDPAFNHIDFFFSENALNLVNKPVLKLLSHY